MLLCGCGVRVTQLDSIQTLAVQFRPIRSIASMNGSCQMTWVVLIEVIRMARPVKLTTHLKEQIALAIRTGNYIEVAAAFAGVSKDTLYRWLRQGQKARSGPYREFSDAVERAMAESEIRDVAIIGKAAEESWQAAAWRLERKHPERWGRKDKVSAEISGRDGGPIEVVDARTALLEKLDAMAKRKEEVEEKGFAELGS
jgi:transposase